MLKIFNKEQFEEWFKSSEVRSWYDLDTWYSVILPNHIITNQSKEIMLWVGDHINYDVIASPNIVTVEPTQKEIDTWNRQFQTINDENDQKTEKLGELKAKRDEKLMAVHRKILDAEEEIEKNQQEVDKAKSELSEFKSKDEGWFIFWPNEAKRQLKLKVQSAQWKLASSKDALKKIKDSYDYDVHIIEKEYEDEKSSIDGNTIKFSSSLFHMYDILLTKQPQNKQVQQGWIFHFARETDAVSFKLTWSEGESC